MTNQGKAVFLVLLISLQYAFGNPSGIILQYCIVIVNFLLLIHAVEMKLVRAQELLGQLATKSATLNGNVVDLQEGVSNLKCGFDTLKDDMTVLETARSQIAMGIPGLEQHDNETASQLSDLLCATEEKKERVRVLKEFTHPCGHGSWERVEYLDFRDAGTACLTVFASDVHSERPYTCSHSNPSAIFECNTHTINVHGREYTKVCGRIRAYGVGFSNAFGQFHTRGHGINEAYVNGVSLTQGGDLSGTANLVTHIWTFAIGQAQFIPPLVLSNLFCPCDRVPPSPDFVGEDYSCEAAIEERGTAAADMLRTNVLWDGENCGTHGNCCTRLSHPYFVKQLEKPTTDNIDLRMCNGTGNEDVALELVEIYIQ